jgi:hypothetical protein
VVQDGVPEDEVERVVLERQSLRLACDRLDVEPEPAGRLRERAQHPRRDVRRDRRADHPGAHQVEREVARARADLERPLEPAGGHGERPQGLAQLARHLRLTDLVVADSPLRVVVLGGQVVVAHVRRADGVRRLHGRRRVDDRPA